MLIKPQPATLLSAPKVNSLNMSEHRLATINENQDEEPAESFVIQTKAEIQKTLFSVSIDYEAMAAIEGIGQLARLLLSEHSHHSSSLIKMDNLLKNSSPSKQLIDEVVALAPKPPKGLCFFNLFACSAFAAVDNFFALLHKYKDDKNKNVEKLTHQLTQFYIKIPDLRKTRPHLKLMKNKVKPC